MFRGFQRGMRVSVVSGALPSSSLAAAAVAAVGSRDRRFRTG
jgi:hypothetical protein